MTFARTLDTDSQLLVLSFLERGSLDAIQLTCRYLYGFVEGTTSLPLRKVDSFRVGRHDESTGEGHVHHSLTVEWNGEREVMVADSLTVAMRHFFIYLRNSYSCQIDIVSVELSTAFVDQLVALRNRFKACHFCMYSARFIDLLDTLASNGVDSPYIKSLDQVAYFDVSDEAIVRFCLGSSGAKRYLVMNNVRVTQALIDQLIQAHRDAENPLVLYLKDPNMPNIVCAGYTERTVSEEQKKNTAYQFATDGWTMEIVAENGGLRVDRWKADSVHRGPGLPCRIREIPTRTRRIV